MSHPDFYDGLMDWPLFGPKDGEIADLVLALADKGLRLAEIEHRIKATSSNLARRYRS